MQFQQPVEIGDVRSAMTTIGFGRAEIKTFGSDRDILIRTSTIELEGGGAVGDRLREGLRTAFPNNPFIVLKEDKIGPKIGAELRRDAIYAVVASLVAIWIYVGVPVQVRLRARGGRRPDPRRPPHAGDGLDL